MIEQISKSEKMNQDEFFVNEFTSNINSSSNTKINIIDIFEKKFFSSRRNISEHYLHLLISTLIPLCGDEYIGSKALYFLNKLLSSDHNRDFQLAINQFQNFPPKTLRKMKLDEYLLKKRFSDFQIQAFFILEIIHSQFEIKSFHSIVMFYAVK